jgi:dCMP deaminase
MRSAEKLRLYDTLWMDIAERCSKMSHAKRLQVGCVVVSSFGQLISHGWNGMPPGMDNCCELYDANGDSYTNPKVIHAEVNAFNKLYNQGTCSRGSTVYITHAPCENCARLIAFHQVIRVVYKNQYRSTVGIEYLQSNHIKVDQFI